ncbi:alanine racemase [Xylanimonas oleitrophica]|uniref:Alanine racemase n=1 Tax=Xylanimonas oleitrophica TaxID=2607479 RepID=A0A2W5YIJ8_9MICO|nr:alanine racemase [Xylanimonas oleitrophica]PZR54901.1 alanine racemase [Xylanimonas oleitrophica]
MTGVTTPEVPAFPAGYPAHAVVDLEAIRDNVRALRGHAPSSALMAVVKADAYGHGLVPSARAALAGGATWLGVAQASEALALRAAGVGPQEARVLTWLHAPGVDFEALLAADVDVSVAAPWALDGVAAAARATGRTARVHLKVDTGLGRNGIVPADVPDAAARAAALQREGLVQVVGVWTHLAFADEPGHPTLDQQRAVFDDAVRTVEGAGVEVELRHAAASAATLTAPGLHYDLVRPGLAVFGLSPVPQAGPPSAYGLRPAMTLQARLATVKRVPAGHGVSYGHLYTTPQDTVLGVVPLGYGDGIPRHASGGSAGPGGPVHVGGQASAGIGATGAAGDGDADTGRVVRVAGRVCMDQVVLDLGPYATEGAGDVVTLFGSSDGLAHAAVVPSAEDWAQAAGTISYEIVTRLGARVPRVHVGQHVLGDHNTAAHEGRGSQSTAGLPAERTVWS